MHAYHDGIEAHLPPSSSDSPEEDSEEDERGEETIEGKHQHMILQEYVEFERAMMARGRRGGP